MFEMDISVKLDFNRQDLADSPEDKVMHLYTFYSDTSPVLPIRNEIEMMDISQPSKTPTEVRYKNPKALCLFDSPNTPKTLYEKCAADSTSGAIRTRSRLGKSRFRSINLHKNSSSPNNRKRSSNINPFTPISLNFGLKKESSRRKLVQNFNNSDASDQTPKTESLLDQCPEISDTSFEEEPVVPDKRMTIEDANITRYRQEFIELSPIGKGEFGGVYKCKHRLDGCIYAIKRSLKPLSGSKDERHALNEVYAHAVLGKHHHIVRYYSAWAEENHMLIQNEYCNGGSLSDLVKENITNNTQFTEAAIKQILLHIARGLKSMHSQNLVHLDIKPDNIFIVKEPKFSPTEESNHDCFEENLEDADDEIIYKIGDLGHVTTTLNPKAEDGDSRYLAKELMLDDFSNLTKADVFSLGMTIYEAALGQPMQTNGTQWLDIRDGNLVDIPSLGSDLKGLIKMMLHPDPHQRPSATKIVHQLCSFNQVNKSQNVQLQEKLKQEKHKSDILAKKLKEANKCLRVLQDSSPIFPMSAAIAKGVLAGVSRSPVGGHRIASRSRHTRSASIKRKYL